MNLSSLTAAQVGSAVRWAITNLGAIGAVSAATQGLDWAALAGALSSLAALGWSLYSNKKKLAA